MYIYIYIRVDIYIYIRICMQLEIVLLVWARFRVSGSRGIPSLVMAMQINSLLKNNLMLKGIAA